jgi:hypothetical protein
MKRVRRRKAAREIFSHFSGALIFWLLFASRQKVEAHRESRKFQPLNVNPNVSIRKVTVCIKNPHGIGVK